MTYAEKSIERVKMFIDARHMSKNRLATEAGIPESTLRTVERDDWSPTLTTLLKLEAAIERLQNGITETSGPEPAGS